MSIKRLNDEERAAYLIGYAVMRQFEEAPPDPDTISEINAVLDGSNIGSRTNSSTTSA